MEIIKDLRTLNALAKKYQLNFDKKYKYCLNCDELTKKFYINQIEFYEIEPLFAAELKKTAVLILYNKNFK